MHHMDMADKPKRKITFKDFNSDTKPGGGFSYKNKEERFRLEALAKAKADDLKEPMRQSIEAMSNPKHYHVRTETENRIADSQNMKRVTWSASIDAQAKIREIDSKRAKEKASTMFNQGCNDYPIKGYNSDNTILYVPNPLKGLPRNFMKKPVDMVKYRLDNPLDPAL